MLAIFLLFHLFSSLYSLTVTTSYGKIEGSEILASDGARSHLFRGIPQIEAPVGENRWKMPKRPKRWEGVLKATKYSAACPSNSTTTSSPQGEIDEDCVYLNIFTSDSCLNTPDCPVLVYIHGGSLSYDSAVMFNTTFLVEQYVSKDIIFVIPSFRLGSLGILHFENETLIPRNLPVYDIIHSLQFIHEEIHNFGGSSSQVTIMGHSMGGCLTLALAFAPHLDPEAKLFQQMVSLSSPLYYQTAKNHLDNSRKILERAGCLLPSETDSFTCFSKLSWQQILEAQRLAEEEGFKLEGITFSPPIGEMNENFRARIEAAPKRNLFIGGTRQEFNQKEDYLGLEIGRFVGLTNSEVLLKKFQRDKENLEHPASKFLSYQSQEVFVPALYYAAVLENKGGHVWLYEYDGDQPRHSGDMMYFIGVHPRPMTPDREAIQSVYIDGIVNFVKGRRPREDWLPLNGTEANYYLIQSNISTGVGPTMMSNYHRAEFEYWTKEMTDYDIMIIHQSDSSWALPLAIGIVLFTVILVTAIVFCLNNKPVAPERRPLLGEQ